ncbi:MAG: hypothetical protein WCX28_12070 [Bacteriovoracaceae bacterium]
MKRLMLFLFLLIFSIANADALPKFGTRQGAKCQSCHINPTGKGMRSTFGSTYGREELTMAMYKEETDIEEYSPMLNDFFTIGMDYRTLFYYREQNSTSSFFQMQGDLYLDLRLNKKFRIYIDKGLYQGFEAFGLAKVLPLEGYIKLGNFIPSYGLKMDDHNLLIRSGSFFPLNPAIATYPGGLGFGQGAEDTGLEIGFSPSIFTVNIGLFNGKKGGIAGTSGTKNKAVVVRADANVQTDLLNFNVGGSLYNLPTANGLGKTQIIGGFGVLTLDNNLTLQGEYDILTTHHPVLNKMVSGNILYGELNYLLTSGVDLKLGYEFYDPNIDLLDGSITRFTIGAELFPLTGIEVRPLYRINQEKPTELKNNELHVMFHFYL